MASVPRSVAGAVPLAGAVYPRESLELVGREVPAGDATQRGGRGLVTRREPSLLGPASRLVVEVLIVPGLVVGHVPGASLRLRFLSLLLLLLELLLLRREENLVGWGRVVVHEGAGRFGRDDRSVVVVAAAAAAAALGRLVRLLGAPAAGELLHDAVAQLVEGRGWRLG